VSGEPPVRRPPQAGRGECGEETRAREVARVRENFRCKFVFTSNKGSSHRIFKHIYIYEVLYIDYL